MPRRPAGPIGRLLRPEPEGLLLSAPDSAEALRHRWASVFGLSVGQLVAWGALYYAYAVLSAPLAEGTGASRGVVAGAFSFALLVSGIAALPVGRALDRHGARVVLLLGTLLGSTALFGLSLVEGTTSLFVVFGVLGIAHATALYEPAIRAIVDWFPRDGDRARALLVLTCVGGLASTAFLPLTAWLLRELGWRSATLVLAFVVALVGAASAAKLAPPRAPGPRTEHAKRGTVEARDTTSDLVAVAFALQSLASTGVSLALVWFLVERGSALSAAAALAGLAGAAQVPGRLGLALLQRVTRSHRRVPVLFFVQALAIVGLGLGSDAATLAAVLLFGLAGGTMTIERATILTEWFGREGFGARSGRAAFVASLARAASPYVVELLRSSAGFLATFRLLALVVAAGGVLLAVAGGGVRARQKQPAH